MLKIALLVLALSAVFSSPFFPTQVYAKAEEPSVTFAKASYTDSRYTGFNVTASTEDAGRIAVIFAWEMASGQRELQRDFLKVYNTYPTLQMVKHLRDGTIDYSLTYIPLYLIQFDDANGNGIFDVQTRRSLARAFSDEEVDWGLSRDRILRMYPLAPMHSRFERDGSSSTWTWRIENLTKIKSEGISEYAWGVSAPVKSFGWQFIDERFRAERDNVDVRFGYRLSLKSEGPTIKLEYGIENVKWAQGQDVKLAIISAVLYHGRDEIVVKKEGEYEGFPGASVKDRRIALVEKTSESIKSVITYSPMAVIDDVNQMDVVKSALQPLFVVSTPQEVPQGVNVRGLNPDFSDRVYWQHYVALAHQISFPRFEEKVYQDPEISLIVPLLLPLPTVLLSPQWFIIVGATVFVVFALLRVMSRRWLRGPFMGRLESDAHESV